MALTLAQADQVNKARNDFLHWCALQDFPGAHVTLAWAFIDTVTKDHDLRAYEGIVSECVDRAKQQLLDASANQSLGLELITVALEGNFETLKDVVFGNKASLLAACPDVSEAPDCSRTPNDSVSAISLETEVIPDLTMDSASKQTDGSHPSARLHSIEIDEPEPPKMELQISEIFGQRRSSKRIVTREREKRLDADQLFMVVPVLRHLMSGQCKRYAEPFWDPVDPVEDDAPDYLEIIEHPMDLETITQKFNSKRYSRASEVKADIKLMLANCYKYNTKNSVVCGLARQFEAEFRKVWKRYID